MKTNRNYKRAASLALLIAGAVMFSLPAGAEDNAPQWRRGRHGQGQGQGQGQRQRFGQGQGQGLRERCKERLLEGAYKERIAEHIKRIEERLKNHPDAPADLKAAAQKLIGDLKAKIAVLDKLAAAVKAEDREAAQAAREELKQAREQCQADREALRNLIKNCVQEHKGRKGNGEGNQFGRRFQHHQRKGTGNGANQER